MKYFSMRHTVLITALLWCSTAYSMPFLSLLHSKKIREVKFIMETYGPASFKCYYSVTGGADLTLDNFQTAYQLGYLTTCLQEKAHEQAEFLKRIPEGIHR